jgi:hypothetical protein
VLFVLQIRLVGGTAFERRLTLLISAGWVPPRLWFVAELPRPRLGRIDAADVHNVAEDSPPGRDAAGLTDLIAAHRGVGYAGGGGTSRAIAQMKPVNSRAIAVATERLTDQLRQLTPAWRWAPVVDALQALRGVSFVTAVGLVTEMGDIRRFDHPRELMAFLGLVPSEYSSGLSVRRGGITKAGNPHARRLLAEAAWAYQGVPRIGPPDALSAKKRCHRPSGRLRGRPNSD